MRARFKYLLLFVLVNLVFFHPFWLKGKIPFPGDLLLAEYSPWKSYSYFGYIPGSMPNKAQSFDAIRQLYPWRKLAIEQFKAGRWPLWNPYNFSGTPLLANFQTAAFYPLNFLYFLPASPLGGPKIPFNLVWALQIMLQPLLASIFTFLFAKRLKISNLGSFLAGLAFGYGSFMTVWLEYNTIGQTILWLPLVLLSLELVLEKLDFTRASLLILALTFSFLAGHPQDFFMLWVFSQIYLLVRKPKNWVKIFLLTFLPFFLAAIQFLPGLELIFNSARSPLDKKYLLKEVLFHPGQLIFAFVPDFFGNPATRNYFLTDTYIGKVLYIGLLPLILALFSLKIKKNFWVKFFSLVALATLFFSLSSPLTGFLYSLPIFKSLSPTRVLFIFQFCLAILAGFGLDYFLKNKSTFSPLVLVGLVFLVAWIFALFKFGVVTQRNLLYSTILLLGVSGLLIGWKIFRWRIFLLGIFILTIFDLWRFFNKITPFCPQEYIFPQAEILDVLKEKSSLPAGRQGIDRFWGYGAAHFDTNYNSLFNLYSAEGYDPLYPRWYGEFIRTSEDGQVKQAIRSDAVIAHGFGRDDFRENKSRQQTLNLLNVRYILDRVENGSDQTTFSPDKYPLIWQKDGWRIYENKKVLPRAYLEKGGETVIEDYQPNKIKIKTDSSTVDKLILADTFYPGWQVKIDSQLVSIERFNHTFRSVAVPAGEHQVEFRYHPFSFRLGLLISAFSCLGFAVLAVIKLRR